MRELVFELVAGLFQQEEVDEPLGGGGLRWPQPLIEHELAIGGEHGGKRMFAPVVERARYLSVFVGGGLERALERSCRRIVDRAQQARQIAGRWHSLAPLGEATAGLSFEVEDDDIILDDEHLPQMKIAVMADFHHFEIFRQKR